MGLIRWDKETQRDTKRKSLALVTPAAQEKIKKEEKNSIVLSYKT